MTPQEQYKLGLALLSQSYKHSSPVGPAANNYAHGPDGLLAALGMRPGVSSAVIMPATGLYNRLPIRANRETSPLYGIYTGIDPDTGSEPVEQCDDPVTAGPSRLCMQTQVWGFTSRKTQVLNVMRSGQIINRGEFTDQTLVNRPLSAAGSPMPVFDERQFDINTEVGKKLLELQVSLIRTKCPDIFTGNPANNSGSVPAGREYYRGLDLLIKTGHVDAVDQVTACDAADSLIRDALADFGISNVAVESLTTVNVITNYINYFTHLASSAGFSSVQHAIVGRWGLFYELAKIWPCAYNTYRCNNIGDGASDVRRNLSATEMSRMSDDMLGDWMNKTGQYLLVDGKRIPFIIDDCIPEVDAGGGNYTSDLYFVPLTVNGGNVRRPVSEGGDLATYMEYFPLSGYQDAPLALAQMFAPEHFSASADGRYLFLKPAPTNLCVDMRAFTRDRLMLETPYLAGRLTTLTYAPIIKERNWNPAGPNYFNGGVTGYANPYA